MLLVVSAVAASEQAAEQASADHDGAPAGQRGAAADRSMAADTTGPLAEPRA